MYPSEWGLHATIRGVFLLYRFSSIGKVTIRLGKHLDDDVPCWSYSEIGSLTVVVKSTNQRTVTLISAVLHGATLGRHSETEHAEVQVEATQKQDDYQDATRMISNAGFTARYQACGRLPPRHLAMDIIK